MELIYGCYHGGDPRDFSPDDEHCTKGEIAAHQAACELWDRAEATGDRNPECARGQFGIGTYVVRDDK